MTDRNGALVIDKPSGPTSHDVVARVRRSLRSRRVGHTGTLDPLATGVLVLLTGRATRLARFLVKDDKEYVADIRLGISTPTYDATSLPLDFRLKAEATRPQAQAEGHALEAHSQETHTHDEFRGFRLQAEDLDAVLEQFRGTFRQTPPPFSAKKVAGRRAYEHARRQEPVELLPVEVTVHDLQIASHAEDLLRLRVACSAGFYVRSLAHDLGQRLGCGAHLEALRRTRTGRFTIDEAVPLDQVEAEGSKAARRLTPLTTLLDHLPALRLSEEGARRAAHGAAVAPWQITDGLAAAASTAQVRLLDPAGDLLAVADRGSDALLHPVVVLV
jgi:tRNA pseudouridine55 synthase